MIFEVAKAPTTTASSIAALVMSQPVRCKPVATDCVIVARRVELFFDPTEQEDFVIHREAERDGEDQDWLGAVQAPNRLEAEHIGEMPILKDEHQRAKGRREREHIQTQSP